MAQLNTIIILRNDSTTAWESSSYQLRKGEVGIEFLDNGKVKMKVGIDGKKTWSQLPYVGAQDAQVFEATVSGSQTKEEALAAVVGEVELNAGDIGIVKTLIANGKYEYTAYVYDNGWKAMDGNYSAENVYFKEDLLTTTKVGNIELTSGQATISAAGKNLVDVFNTIFVKETNTGLKEESPEASVSGGGVTYYEIGTTGSKSVTVSLSKDGKYKYGYTPDEGNEGDSASSTVNDGSTGVTASGYKLTFDGVTTPAEGYQSEGSFTLSPKARTTKASLSATGVVSYTTGNIPVSNLKKMYPAQRIAAGTDDATTELFRWYVPMFQGFTYSGENVVADPANITAEQIEALTAPAASKAGSTDVGAVKKIDKANAYNKVKVNTATASKAWRQYFLVVPSEYKWTMSGAKDGNNIDCTVNKAADVTINIHGTDVVYNVYYINNAADYGTKSISWTM